MSNYKEPRGLHSLCILTACVALAFIATVGKGLFNLLADNGVAWDDPSSSVASSMFHGTFVCSVRAYPESFEWKGTLISFGQTWIEHQVHTSHPYIWGWHVEKSGRDLLCFNLKSGKELLQRGSPFFNGSGFLYGGSVGEQSGGGQVLFYGELTPEAVTAHRTDLALLRAGEDAHKPLTILSW